MDIPEPVAKYFSHAAAVSPYVGIAAAFVFFRKILPAHTDTVTTKSLPQLRAEYQPWERRTGLIMFLLVAPLSVLFWYAFTAGARWYTDHALPPAEVTFVPFSIFWVLPAMFFGMLASGPLLFRISHLVLKDRYPEYLAYQSLRYGFDSAKANKILMIGLAIVCVLLMFFGLNTYVQLADNVLTVDVFGVEHRHDLSTTESIQTAPQLVAPNGNTVTRREYLITFKDGTSWSTSELLARIDDKGKRDFMDILAKKSGLPIQEIPIFEKGKI